LSRMRLASPTFDVPALGHHKAPHRIVFFAFDLLHLDGQDLRRIPLMERRAALRKLIEPDPQSPIQFSDHADWDGALVFKLAADLGPEGIVSKRATSLHRGGPSKNWLTKNMVESQFILLGTEVDDSGIPWALLAREKDGELKFAGPAILRPPSHARAEWADKFAAMLIDKPALEGLRRARRAQWLNPRSGSGFNISRPKARSSTLL
jgi:bifunctional non-homologous end joining protein LigD